MKRQLFALLIVLACVLCAQPGFAQDIVELNEQGITAFQEGRFGDAARKFQEAYALKPEQTLKKNEAVAWFKASKCDEALTAAHEYLGLQPTDELSVKEAQAVVVNCNVQKAETAFGSDDLAGAETFLAEAKKHTPTEEQTQKITEVETQIAAKREAAEKERERKLAEEQRRKEEEAAQAQSSKKRVLGLGLASAGASLLIGTLVYHVVMATSVASNFKDVAAAGEDPDEYDRLGKQLETANWLVPTLYAVGGLTTGLGVYFWLSAGSAESNPAEAANAGAGGNGETSFGFVATWRF